MLSVVTKIRHAMCYVRYCSKGKSVLTEAVEAES